MNSEKIIHFSFANSHVLIADFAVSIDLRQMEIIKSPMITRVAMGSCLSHGE